VKRHTPITQWLAREDEDGEVMVARGLHVTRRLKGPIAGELRLSQERQNSRLCEDGAQRECRHDSVPATHPTANSYEPAREPV
jgi:hypothetical protein